MLKKEKEQKLHEFYQFCKEINPLELEDLMEKSVTKEEKDFYWTISNYFLQQRQKEIINNQEDKNRE